VQAVRRRFVGLAATLASIAATAAVAASVVATVIAMTIATVAAMTIATVAAVTIATVAAMTIAILSRMNGGEIARRNETVVNSERVLRRQHLGVGNQAIGLRHGVRRIEALRVRCRALTLLLTVAAVTVALAVPVVVVLVVRNRVRAGERDGSVRVENPLHEAPKTVVCAQCAAEYAYLSDLEAHVALRHK